MEAFIPSHGYTLVALVGAPDGEANPLSITTPTDRECAARVVNLNLFLVE